MRAFSCHALVVLAVCWLTQAASAQQSDCQVTQSDFLPDIVSTAVMVVEGAGPCQFKFRFGGQNAPDSWELVEAPKSGKVTFSGDAAEYRPDPGFAGDDKFVITFTGSRPNCTKNCFRRGRYAVAVTVKPKP